MKLWLYEQFDGILTASNIDAEERLWWAPVPIYIDTSGIYSKRDSQNT